MTAIVSAGLLPALIVTLVEIVPIALLLLPFTLIGLTPLLLLATPLLAALLILLSTFVLLVALIHLLVTHIRLLGERGLDRRCYVYATDVPSNQQRSCASRKLDDRATK